MFALAGLPEETTQPSLDGQYSLPRILALAEQLAWVRPLGRYPDWRFDSGVEGDELGLRLRRMIWEYFHSRKMQERITVNWYHDLKLHLYLSNDTSRQIFVGGCNEPNELTLLDELLSEGMTFVDAGANEGLYTLLAARRVGPGGTVWAFEPSQREHGRLRANLELNRLENVRTFPLALGNAHHEAEMLIAAGDHAGHNTLGAFVYDTQLCHKERVQVAPLDSLVRQHGLRRIDVLKIDVEGGEVALLQGAEEVLRSMRPVLFLEVNDAALRAQNTDRTRLLNLLLLHGYELFVFDSLTGKPRLAVQGECTDNIVAVPRGGPVAERLLAEQNVVEQLRRTTAELHEARTQLEEMSSLKRELEEAREAIQGMKSTRVWKLRTLLRRLLLLSRDP